jgi:ParB/RepB/Spo0J family partition protein
MNVQPIPVNSIAPPLFNSRIVGIGNTQLSDTTLSSLAESIKVRQLEPIGVTPDGETAGRYRLLYGSRRLAAAKLAGLETIAADVQLPTSEADEILANGVENMQRKDLTTYEQARLCAELRKHKLTGKQVAAALGISVAHASNLAVCFEKLPAGILLAWKEQQPATDMNFLRSIVTKKVDGKTVDATVEEMTAAYNERVDALAPIAADQEDHSEEDEDDDDDNVSTRGETAGAPPPKKFIVPKERYRELLKALQAVRAATMTIDAVRYLVGDIEKIRGVPIGAAKKVEPKADKKTDTKKKGK